MIYFSDILNTVLPMLLAFAISTVTGHFLIPQLRRLKVQQTERGEGPQSHLGKSGTPNMGGLMIIAAFTVTGLIFAVKDARILPVVFMTLGFGLVGFVDDFIKVTKKRSEGLTVRQKMAFQILISLVFGLILIYFNEISLDMIIPFGRGAVLHLGWFGLPALIFIAVATVNGTNLTDGVDGLCGSVTTVVSLVFTIIAVLQHNNVSAASGAMTGALLGFLIYNAYPAKVFMGDTGSLALGGFIVGIAYVMQLPLFIPIIGFIYLLESVTVMIQVGWFKYTKRKYGEGRRVFRMTPFHHHLELGGWSEVRVTALFTAITAVAGAVSLLAIW